MSIATGASNTVRKGDGNSRAVGSKRREEKVREMYFLAHPGIRKFGVAEVSARNRGIKYSEQRGWKLTSCWVEAKRR
jgi:hypothetical protein